MNQLDKHQLISQSSKVIKLTFTSRSPNSTCIVSKEIIIFSQEWHILLCRSCKWKEEPVQRTFRVQTVIRRSLKKKLFYFKFNHFSLSR